MTSGQFVSWVDSQPQNSLVRLKIQFLERIKVSTIPISHLMHNQIKIGPPTNSAKIPLPHIFIGQGFSYQYTSLMKKLQTPNHQFWHFSQSPNNIKFNKTLYFLSLSQYVNYKSLLITSNKRSSLSLYPLDVFSSCQIFCKAGQSFSIHLLSCQQWGIYHV